MPLQPLNTRMAPPGGWSVTIEGLGPTIRSDNYAEFIAQVKRRLEANGKDEHGWKDMVLTLMCQQRPDIPCEDTGVMPSRVADSNDIKRFVKTIWTAWKDGAEAVSQEEQDRRGDICLHCPSRGHVSCFGGCGTLAEMMSQMVVGTKSKPRPDLHKTSCMHCGCDCSLLILFPLDVLQKVDAEVGFKNGELPSHCWKLDQPNIPIPPPSSAHPPPVGT
jgi:hypothetical protein